MKFEWKFKPLWTKQFDGFHSQADGRSQRGDGSNEIKNIPFKSPTKVILPFPSNPSKNDFFDNQIEWVKDMIYLLNYSGLSDLAVGPIDQYNKNLTIFTQLMNPIHIIRPLIQTFPDFLISWNSHSNHNNINFFMAMGEINKNNLEASLEEYFLSRVTFLFFMKFMMILCV